MDIKDIESGTSHVANEVLLLLCNDRKWHDSWVDYVAFVKTSDFYDRWPHKAVDLMAVDLFSRMHDAGALDGLGEDAILADHFYAAGRAVIHAVRDAVNDGRLPF